MNLSSVRHLVCLECGVSFETSDFRKQYCKRQCAMRGASKRYNKSDKGVVSRRKLRSFEQYKKTQIKYNESIEGREAKRQRDLNYQHKYPEKRAAQTAVSNAVRLGKLFKPLVCSLCGEEFDSRQIQGHHHLGYKLEHHLDVTWLCGGCHNKTHMLGDAFERN